MALYLLVFGVCLLVMGAVLLVLMNAGTPRYRTEPNHLLQVFDRVLTSHSMATLWALAPTAVLANLN